MKYALPLLLLVAVGCQTKTTKMSSGGDDSAGQIGNVPPTFDKAKAEEKLAKAPALGEKQVAEKIAATLTTDPKTLKVGEAKFVATVTLAGKPYQNATLILDLTMPAMNMGGPRILLSHTKNGVYEGLGSMPMAGDYLGILRVKDEKDKETSFEFKFEAEP